MHSLRLLVIFSLVALSKTAILKPQSLDREIKNNNVETTEIEPNLKNSEINSLNQEINDPESDIETFSFETKVENYEPQRLDQGIRDTDVETIKFESNKNDYEPKTSDQEIEIVKFQTNTNKNEPQNLYQKDDVETENFEPNINSEPHSLGTENTDIKNMKNQPNIENDELISLVQGIEETDVETVKFEPNINSEANNLDQENKDKYLESIKLQTNIENDKLQSLDQGYENTEIETVSFESKMENYEPNGIETVTFGSNKANYETQSTNQVNKDTDVETVSFGPNIENNEQKSSNQGIEDTIFETVTFESNIETYELKSLDQGAKGTDVETVTFGSNKENYESLIKDGDSNAFYEPPSNEVTVFGYHMKIGVPIALQLMDSESQPTRVANGTLISDPSDIPYQAGIVALLTTGWHSVCGGSLISQTRVLTAAHCWWDGQNQASSFTVVLGSTTIFSGGTRIETSAVTVHASWTAKTITHDIAIVTITSVTYTNNIQAIPLPDSTYSSLDFAGMTGVVSGFGKTADNQTHSTTHLHHVSVNVIMNSVCQASFQTVTLDSSHLCTSGTGSVGSCDGDSGGPLTTVYNNTRILIGVVSFGLSEGCQYGNPSVYTRVTSFLDWITSRM